MWKVSGDHQCDEFENTDETFIHPTTPDIHGLRRVSTGDIGNRTAQRRWKLFSGSTALTFARAASGETTMSMNRIVRMVKKRPEGYEGAERWADKGIYLTGVAAFYRSVQDRVVNSGHAMEGLLNSSAPLGYDRKPSSPFCTSP